MRRNARDTSSSPHKQPRDIRPFLIAWCVYSLVLLVCGATLLRHTSEAFDFRSMYAAGYMARTDPVHLYDIARQQQVQSALVSTGNKAIPFFHPSYEALLYAPFSLLSYHDAYVCFMALNLIVLAILFLVGYEFFSPHVELWQPRPGLMFFPFLALFVAIWHGQNSVIFLLLCTLTCLQLEKNAELRAGVLLALGLFKFHVALPLAVLCAVRRGWKFTAGFAASALVVVGLCFAVAGGRGMASFAHLITAASLAGDQSATAQANIAVFPQTMPNLVGLLSPLTHRVPARAAFEVVAAASATVFGWCLYLGRRAKDERTAFAIGMLGAALVSYHMFVTDYTIVLLPLALLLNRLSKTLLAAIYGVPALILATVGRNGLFLPALLTLWMLMVASRETEPRRVMLEEIA